MRTFIKSLLVAAIAIVGTTYESVAQVPTRVKTSNTFTLRTGGFNVNGTVKSRDTLSNADSNTLGTAVNYAYDLSFNYTINRLSGTLAGNARLYGTSDSANGPWYLVRGTTTQCVGCTDSVATFTNAATNSFTWKVTKSPFKYYRMQSITSGTVTATPALTLDYQY